MNNKMNASNTIIPSKHILTKTTLGYNPKYIGVDTEADNSGKCQLIGFSDKTYYPAICIPDIFFVKALISNHYVVYNMKYEEGALLQHLPLEKLEELRHNKKCKHNKYRYKIIPGKMISISNQHITIYIWDIYPMYATSLNKASQTYLQLSKIACDIDNISAYNMTLRWDEIGQYCAYDAYLTLQLAELFLNRLKPLMNPPIKLYSVAYIAGNYFMQHCKIPTYHRIQKYYPKLFDTSILTYHGGKFETTVKGCDYYYTYDISSAYPYEIANLIDITGAEIEYNRTVDLNANYSIIHMAVNIPCSIYHPLSYKHYNVIKYPIGIFTTYCTLEEYKYILKHNIPYHVIECWNIYCNTNNKPFYNQITQLYNQKESYKHNGDIIYSTVIKTILNSFYGKMCQSVSTSKGYKTSIFFNPIYASAITANVRIRISELQNEYDDIHMVCTDSITCNKPHPEICGEGLGSWKLQDEGNGIIIGNGIYEINNNKKIRGFHNQDTIPSLYDLCNCNNREIYINQTLVKYWRKVLHQHMPIEEINEFYKIDKKLSIDFDTKRIWIDDWKTFKEALYRKVYSTPVPVTIL